MAADILVQSPHFVLVGEDQRQHVEFTRLVSRRCNALAETRSKQIDSASPRLPPHASTLSVENINEGECAVMGDSNSSVTAVEPVCLHASPWSARVRCLRNPTQKMSKSSPSAAGRIGLLDPPEVVERKIARAVTDSFPGKCLCCIKRPPSNPAVYFSHEPNWCEASIFTWESPGCRSRFFRCRLRPRATPRREQPADSLRSTQRPEVSACRRRSFALRVLVSCQTPPS